MFATRVGYAGGTTSQPTYRRIGDHTETLEIDFDPQVVSYNELLNRFFASHNACSTPWSQQYMSAIFCQDDTQLQQAQAAAERTAKTKGQAVKTRIERAGPFYLAEDYHQKYRLRSQKTIDAELMAIYPELTDYVNSTAATRLNGYLAGHGSREDFERDLARMGLSPAATELVRSRCGRLSGRR